MDNKQEIKKSYNKQLIITICCICVAIAVAAIAAYSFITRAWSAQNRKLGNGGFLVAETLDNSVFIEPVTGSNAGSPAGSFAGSAQASLSGDLYPISTIDCANWYRAGTWDAQAKKYTSYIRVTPAADDANHQDRYGYSVGEGQNIKHYTAYNKAEFWIYTDELSKDIYFDPAGPIEISIDQDKDAISGRAVYLKQALRIGIQIGDSFVVYAPSAENGTGNSQGAQANKLYAINAGGVLTPVGDAEHFYTELSSYAAIELEAPNPSGSSGEAEGVYGAGVNKLCTAGSIDGGNYKKMSVFIWLEGTDAQAVRGRSNNADGIGIAINLVGADPSDP